MRGAFDVAELHDIAGDEVSDVRVMESLPPREPRVKTFQGYGMGSYVVFIDTSATLNVTSAFQAPDTPGVSFSNVFGVWIGGSGGLDSVVNGVGGPVTSTDPGTVEPVDVTSYP